MFPLTPALSLKGEGVVRADIILWGTLSLWERAGVRATDLTYPLIGEFRRLRG